MKRVFDTLNSMSFILPKDYHLTSDKYFLPNGQGFINTENYLSDKGNVISFFEIHRNNDEFFESYDNFCKDSKLLSKKFELYEKYKLRLGDYVFPIYIDDDEVDLYIAVDSAVELGSMPIIRKMRMNSAVFDDGSSKGTVVIVDDSGMSRKMLRTILEDAGFAVVGEASDGMEGVLAYKQLSPDVITLDITMPNMDGTEALRQIKDYDEDAKAVMITAAGQQNKVIEALKIGAEKFITKPFDKDEVVRAVEELVEK